MKIRAAAREYLIDIEVRKFTAKTIRSYKNNLNLFVRYCNEIEGIDQMEDVSLAVVRNFSRYMSSKGKKGSYINGLLKVAKRIYKAMTARGLSSALLSSVRKSTPLQTTENTLFVLFLKYENKFTNMFTNALTFTNTNDIIRTD